ncbi:P63C domain-containing protein [Roseicyclus marinus]|uniref:P63C domain-containing protein n=1 Tax=Roseicyclus marinus TaxID=2161673 RepID=UPI00240F8A95|nr:P63C domain-containing protein [Roseicyclus marinus]MDG3041883.1 P63C domain-containing protein [Roseicyclus marinus]
MMDGHHSKGGRSRAENLSPERRAEIARKAAAARWGNLREAIGHEGSLTIGGAELACYVLDDETRVLSRASFVRAIGRTGKVKGGRKFDDEFQTPVFLSAENLRTFFPSDLVENAKPILFTHNGMEMIGYRAELLPDVCDIFADAERAGVLRANQMHIAEACRILSRGLTRVGIIGLVDEATGYQKFRAANALAQVLEKFIAKELQPWMKTFPEEFYEELFRLRGINNYGETVKRPQYFGHLTNDIVYSRLAPGVKEELGRTTPKLPSGRRKHQMHRKLTPDLGHPKLREHLASVTTIMKLSDDYSDFVRKLDRVHPRFGDTIPMDFGGQ